MTCCLTELFVKKRFHNANLLCKLAMPFIYTQYCGSRCFVKLPHHIYFAWLPCSLKSFPFGWARCSALVNKSEWCMPFGIVSSQSSQLWSYQGNIFTIGEKKKTGQDVLLVSRPIKSTSHEAATHYHFSPEAYKVPLILWHHWLKSMLRSLCPWLALMPWGGPGVGILLWCTSSHWT